MATATRHRRTRLAVLAGLLLAPLLGGSAYLGLDGRQLPPDLLGGVRPGDSREHAVAALSARGLEVTSLRGADGSEQLMLSAVPAELAVDEARVPGVVVLHLTDGRVTGFSAAFDGGDDPVFLFDELAARWADRLGRPELDERWADADGAAGLQVEWSSPQPTRIVLEDGDVRLGSWARPQA